MLYVWRFKSGPRHYLYRYANSPEPRERRLPFVYVDYPYTCINDTTIMSSF